MLVYLIILFSIYQCNFKCICRELGGDRVNKEDLQKLLDPLREGIKNFKNITTQNIANLQKLLEILLPKNFLMVSSSLSKLHFDIICLLCRLFAGKLILLIRIKSSDIGLFLSEFLCKVFGIFINSHVCKNAVQINFDIIVHIIENNKNLTGRQACAIISQRFGCYKEYRPQWTVPIPPGFSAKKRIPKYRRGENRNPLRILQFTDVHIDPIYTVNATTKCNRPLCCQRDNKLDMKDGAGYWGDYHNCDMPWHSFKNFLDYAASLHEKSPISYVYFTGDIINHRIWEGSIRENIKVITEMYTMVKQRLGFVKVFPIVGNHEPFPTNVFSPTNVPPEFSTKWLYDLMADEWAVWLPTSALETVRKGGFYTVLLQKGLRVIVLNTNVCYTYNWWLLYKNVDLYQQLAWLIKVLKKAEKEHEAVHILGHAPPGDPECLTAWAEQFQKIVERFSHTIVAQFNGHTHYDEFRVFYNTSNISQAINVAWNGGSLTTFVHVNPNFRIYDINPKTYEVADFTEWIYQIPIANFFPQKSPHWYKLYSFKKGYGLKNLKLKELNSLVEEMSWNNVLNKKYYRYKVRDAETSMVTGCDRACIKSNICSLVTTVFDNNIKCNQLTGNTTL